MKKLIILVALVCPIAGHGACTETGTIYTACKPGYYLENKNCVACPDGGTSADQNKSGISDCYLQSGTSVSDGTGIFKYNENCNYTH